PAYNDAMKQSWKRERQPIVYGVQQLPQQSATIDESRVRLQPGDASSSPIAFLRVDAGVAAFHNRSRSDEDRTITASMLIFRSLRGIWRFPLCDARHATSQAKLKHLIGRIY